MHLLVPVMKTSRTVHILQIRTKSVITHDCCDKSLSLTGLSKIRTLTDFNLILELVSTNVALALGDLGIIPKFP